MPELFQDKPNAAQWLKACLARPAQQAVRALARKG
jgi:hypothetical protein